jgi:hypothetical protein
VTGKPLPNYVEKFKPLEYLKKATAIGLEYLKENAIGTGDPGAMGAPPEWYDRSHPDFQPSIYADKPIEMKAAEIPDLLHASPHKFEKFAMNNMGGGEGVQAFGWGLYFSDSKSVNRHYLKKFGRQITIPQGAYDDAYKQLEPTWEKLDPVLSDFMEKQSDFLENTRQEVKAAGKSNVNIGIKLKQFQKAHPKETALERLSAIFEDESTTMAKRELESVNLKHLDEIDQEYGTNLYEVVKGLKDKMKKGAYNYEVTLHKGKQPSEYSYLKWYDNPKEDQIKKIESALKNKLQSDEKVSQILYYEDVNDEGIDLIVDINQKIGAYVKTKMKPGATWADLTDEEDMVISAFENLEEQSAGYIQDAIHLFKTHKKDLDPNLVRELTPMVEDLSKVKIKKIEPHYTEVIYEKLTELFGGGPEGQKEASLFLKSAGIDGIEYPARSLSGRASKTEKNYVIFDADAAHIERIYEPK